MSLFGHRRDLRLWRAELGDVGRWAPPDAQRPPIERVAADLRRLRRQLASLPVGASYVRSNGLRRAYDEVLAIACEELCVPTRLTQLRDGPPRDLERLRVEFELGECGLLLH